MTTMHGFIVYELYKKIEKDIRDFYIFNEADVQSRVYMHLQKNLEKYAKPRLLLNKPTYTGKGKRLIYPDFVIVNEYGIPEAAIELKFAKKGLPDPKKDIGKLRNFKRRHKTTKKAYFIFIYDDESLWELRREKWMKHYLFAIGINMKISIAHKPQIKLKTLQLFREIKCRILRKRNTLKELKKCSKNFIQ